MFHKNIFTLFLNSISTNIHYSMDKKKKNKKKQKKCFNHIVPAPQNRENRVPFFSQDILVSSQWFLSLIGDVPILPHFKAIIFTCFLKKSYIKQLKIPPLTNFFHFSVRYFSKKSNVFK